jgi:hypothetical protein
VLENTSFLKEAAVSEEKERKYHTQKLGKDLKEV